MNQRTRGNEMVVDQELLSRLWKLFATSSRSPCVMDELERLFPDDTDTQRMYRNLLVDMGREGLGESERTCPHCGRVMATRRSFSGHVTKCSGS